MKETNWELEAKKQVAANGGLKITMAQRLDDIRARIENTRRQKEAAEDNVEQVVLAWKLGQLEDQEKWLESVLRTGGRA